MTHRHNVHRIHDNHSKPAPVHLHLTPPPLYTALRRFVFFGARPVRRRWKPQ
jgi:hypothetical protein